MNITQIQCFCAIVKYGSFSRAAEKLFMSQSAVSKHMAALEKECGFPLIIRKRRSGQVDLSLEGQLMLRDCNKLLRDYENLLHLRNEMCKKPLVASMSFSLMGIPEMAHYGIVSSVNSFSSTHPNTLIHIVEADEFFIQLALLNKESDLAFISDIGLDPQQFNWQNYCTEKLSAVVSRRSPLAKKEKINMRDLDHYPLIAGPKKTNLFDFCLSVCQSVGVEPKFVFLTSRLSIALDYLKEHSDTVFLTAANTVFSLNNNENNTEYKTLNIINSPTFHYVFAWRRGQILDEKIRQYLQSVAEPASETFLKEYHENSLCTLE